MFSSYLIFRTTGKVQTLNESVMHHRKNPADSTRRALAQHRPSVIKMVLARMPSSGILHRVAPLTTVTLRNISEDGIHSREHLKYYIALTAWAL
jgi:hypothetical protein